MTNLKSRSTVQVWPHHLTYLAVIHLLLLHLLQSDIRLTFTQNLLVLCGMGVGLGAGVDAYTLVVFPALCLELTILQTHVLSFNFCKLRLKFMQVLKETGIFSK